MPTNYLPTEDELAFRYRGIDVPAAAVPEYARQSLFQRAISLLGEKAARAAYGLGALEPPTFANPEGGAIVRNIARALGPALEDPERAQRIERETAESVGRGIPQPAP